MAAMTNDEPMTGRLCHICLSKAVPGYVASIWKLIRQKHEKPTSNEARGLSRPIVRDDPVLYYLLVLTAAPALPFLIVAIAFFPEPAAQAHKLTGKVAHVAVGDTLTVGPFANESAPSLLAGA